MDCQENISGHGTRLSFSCCSVVIIVIVIVKRVYYYDGYIEQRDYYFNSLPTYDSSFLIVECRIFHKEESVKKYFV